MDTVGKTPTSSSEKIGLNMDQFGLKMGKLGLRMGQLGLNLDQKLAHCASIVPAVQQLDLVLHPTKIKTYVVIIAAAVEYVFKCQMISENILRIIVRLFETLENDDTTTTATGHCRITTNDVDKGSRGVVGLGQLLVTSQA